MADTTPFIKFDSFQQAELYAQEAGISIMFMDNQVIDATSFAKHHPGGNNNILKSKNKQITHQIKGHFPLSEKLAESMAIGYVGMQKQRILDYSKPLAKQIWHLDQAKYNLVIHQPHWFFVPSPRLFQNEIIEKLSYSKWWHVSILPFILIIYMFTEIQNWQQLDIKISILMAFLGALLFTLIEYSLHRFVFHAEWYLPDHRIIRMVHFFLHGIHHMLPNDPNRLVLPPGFALVIMLIARVTILQILYFSNAIFGAFFWSGYLMGYVVYDSTHYFLHFLDTSRHPGTYFHQLQRYHNQHHYGGEHAGFGVSSKLWDIVFRTTFKFNRQKGL